jgi:hypothetical protein
VIRRLRELWLKTAISMYGPGDQKFAIVDGTVDRYDRAYAIRGWIGAAGQQFRFVHPDGEKQFTVSTTGLRGETLVSKARGGEVRTRDAEIAKLLRRAYLREL